ncbi:MAG: ABC transporter substrate-binding protein [Acutalibacteraceae bacterium]|nr:ABC transporter substrate-binding protein [Acutalibacteraceae bacterium]
MNKATKITAVFMALCMSASAIALSGCNESSSSSSSGESKLNSSSKVDTSSVEEIYYLNFKPEISDKYEEIAKKYEEETGIKVKVSTAASGEYEKTLTTQMANADTAPTIFQINGPVGYENWKDYCADLSDTEFYNTLSDKTLAVKSGDGVYGIPYAVEGYGIIYNNAIMEKYFKSDKKSTEYKSMDEINTYDKLKAVVEDMTKIKDELGIKGVFGSTSLKTGDDWRWQTHLMNLPLYYEFNSDSESSILSCLNSKELGFKYSDNFKNIFDLYTDNSCTEKNQLGSKTVDESMGEFALGNVAMIQNGNWAWDQISQTKGNVVEADDIKYLPIYTGVEGEENQGLCIGTENYFAINSQADPAEQQASIEFLEWLFSSEYGKKAVVEELGFIAPFTTFTDDEKPDNPLAKEVLGWMEKDGVESVAWTFQGIPSEQWKQDFGADLLKYVQGQEEWSKVVDNAKSSWKTEVELKSE